MTTSGADIRSRTAKVETDAMTFWWKNRAGTLSLNLKPAAKMIWKTRLMKRLPKSSQSAMEQISLKMSALLKSALRFAGNVAVSRQTI